MRLFDLLIAKIFLCADIKKLAEGIGKPRFAFHLGTNHDNTINR